MLKSVGLYYHTIKYLRLKQIVGRVLKLFKTARIDDAIAPRLRYLKVGNYIWIKRRQSLIGQREFLFLNQTGELDLIDWDGPQREKLWRYNQHYFDDLNAENAGIRFEWHYRLIGDWIEQNPPGIGTGWEPGPTSLRIVNWIKWALTGNKLPDLFEHSLAIQTRWLMRNLETHILGNHYFSNAKALIFAGTFFEGAEAERWLSKGLNILEIELPEQILPDGGHFERSTMYHALALEDILDLIQLEESSCVATAYKREYLKQLKERAPSMIQWLSAMSAPDGEISFFNDAAVSIAAKPEQLMEYADRLGSRSLSAPIWLNHSGYARLENEFAVLWVDLAPVGPDYIPGHAHADSLSFEFALFGSRVFVNTGTSVYAYGSERMRQRGTAAHNTVEVCGRDSSEVWGQFRVARRARIRQAFVQIEKKGGVAEGIHDGYCRLSKSAFHARKLSLGQHTLRIEDKIGDPALPAIARFHLHPDCHAELFENGRFGKIYRCGELLATCTIEMGSGTVECSTWNPSFGVSMPSQCIAIELNMGISIVEFSWLRHELGA